MTRCFANWFSYLFTRISATSESRLEYFVDLSMSVIDPSFYYHEMLKFRDQQIASVEVLL